MNNIKNNKKKYPKVSVKAVFLAGNRVMYHKTKDGIRDIPGGHIEFGETIMQTLQRELKEELGLYLRKNPKLLYAWSYISRDRSAQRIYIVYLINFGKKVPNLIHKERNDIEFIWLEKKDIKKQHFLPEMEKLLLKAFD